MPLADHIMTETVKCLELQLLYIDFFFQYGIWLQCVLEDTNSRQINPNHEIQGKLFWPISPARISVFHNVKRLGI